MSTEYEELLDPATQKLLDQVIAPYETGEAMRNTRARKEDAVVLAESKGHTVVWLGHDRFTRAELAICPVCEASGRVFPEPIIREGQYVGTFEDGDLFTDLCIDIEGESDG